MQRKLIFLLGCALGWAGPAAGQPIVLSPDAVSALAITGDAGSPVASPVNPVGETLHARARDFASGPVRGHLNYLRFDLSTLSNPSLQSAALRLQRVSGDTVVPSRVAIYGLLELPGNAPQDWAASGFPAGDEFDISMYQDAVASVGETPVNLSQVVDFSADVTVSGNSVTVQSAAVLDFLQERADADGLATFLLTIPSLGAGTDREVVYASHNHPDAAARPRLEIVYFDSDLPSPPENLRVANILFTADPAVTLTWDAVPDVTGYQVYRRAPGEAEATHVAELSGNTFADTDVELLETWYYSVSVATAGGQSIPSNEIEVRVSDASIPVPAVPEAFELTTAEADAIGFQWQSSPEAIVYEVYRSTLSDRGYVSVGSVTANTFFDGDGIEAYRTYYYIVSAVGAGGMSAFSKPFEVGPRFESGTTVPGDSGMPTVTDRELHAIELAWQEAEDAEAYYVFRGTNPDGPFQLLDVANAALFRDAFGVYPEYSYFYYVVPVNANGFGGASDVGEAAPFLAVHRRMESLTRAPVALAAQAGMLVGWRLLGTDPDDVAFHVYRDGSRITDEPITGRSNLIDTEGTASSTYQVAAVVDGVELPGEMAAVLSENYLPVPLQVPSGGVSPDGVSYAYSANDGSVADLDGDGEYEFILKWDPSNSKDNAQAGHTGHVYLDAYELDGTFLWRIDLGPNIRAGAHYTQFMVYDFDGDGRAELICKTADGTVDGIGQVIGDPTADWRNSAGYVLDGPEYLTVFDGRTGAVIDTVDYIPPRGDVSSWGDDYGNRVDRFLAGVAYLDGVSPSYFAARGQYRGQGGTDGRTVIAAFDLIDGNLVERWVFDSLVEGREWAGQGHHQLSVGDVDGDGRDEILYGGMTVDDDGTGLYTTEYGTGDAMHFGDFDPTRPGREVVAVKEESGAPVHVEYRDAATGALIWGVNNSRDTGRGLVADIDPTYPGAEVWGAANLSVWNSDGEVIGEVRPSINFATWWTGDLQRELTDGISVRRWDYVMGSEVEIMVAHGTASNNGTKANSVLQADLLGDWREEVVFRSLDSSELRIYTTSEPTGHGIHSLMQDPNYRLAVAWQNNGYNQPPHPSFFIGNNMPSVPRPNVFVTPEPVLLGTGNGSDFTSAVDVVLAVNRSRGLTNEYRINGGTWSPYAGAFRLEEDGQHLLEFRTRGNGGDILAQAAVALTIQLPVPGDLNGDGVVDRHDRTIVQKARGTCEGDPGYVAAADYTGDGCVTQDDFKIWTQLFVEYVQGGN